MKIHQKFAGLDWLELVLIIIEAFVGLWCWFLMEAAFGIQCGLGTCSLDPTCAQKGIAEYNQAKIVFILILLAIVFGQHFLISLWKKRVGK